jgi:hypothetical protein
VRGTSSLVLAHLGQVFGIVMMAKMELGLDPFRFASASIVFPARVLKEVVPA